jgi:hypothetical protein
MTSLPLVRVIDESIITCQTVKDNMRQVLLEGTKEKIEWLPVSLDCKKLEIQRHSTRKLEEHYRSIRRDLAQALPARQAQTLRESEVDTLDCAWMEFQEHRLAFMVEMLKALKQLLEATG